MSALDDYMMLRAEATGFVLKWTAILALPVGIFYGIYRLVLFVLEN